MKGAGTKSWTEFLALRKKDEASVNLRRAVRYPLHLPVIFRWTGDCQDSEQGAGFSRDVGTGGAYILSEPGSCPPLNTPVSLQMFLPSLEGTTRGIRVEVEGVVTRVTGSLESSGFAVVADLRFDPADSRDPGTR
jgi:hypothetical protein